VTGLEELVIVLTGLGAGIMTSTVGVSSLLSFPVLIALGLPPVVANASNAVGLTPGAVTGSFGYRSELREHPVVATTVIGTGAVGAAGGAVLLLALPPGVFEAVVPWLILGTCLLVGAQPRISRWLTRTADAVPPDAHTRLSPATTFFSTLVGVYGGYFGAGSGVMMMAVLGLGSNLEFRILNALKTLAVLACNLVASVVFVLVAELDWTAVALLAAGSVVGGYVGARVGRRLNPTVLRSLIVVVGVGAAIRMLA
jgi:uncharacterized protein